MRDEHYRSLCDSPASYDAVIDWIMMHNPAAARSGDVEEFACHAVNSCIRQVVFGDGGSFCSTGMAIAVRVSSREDSPSYKKVVLGVTLLHLAKP